MGWGRGDPQPRGQGVAEGELRGRGRNAGGWKTFGERGRGRPACLCGIGHSKWRLILPLVRMSNCLCATSREDASMCYCFLLVRSDIIRVVFFF